MMISKKQNIIINLAVESQLDRLKDILGKNPRQVELDIALEHSIAYSFIDIAEFLHLKGANFAYNN